MKLLLIKIGVGINHSETPNLNTRHWDWTCFHQQKWRSLSVPSGYPMRKKLTDQSLVVDPPRGGGVPVPMTFNGLIQPFPTC